MHSTSYQTLLILLPIIITGSQALPDNVFGKREALYVSTHTLHSSSQRLTYHTSAPILEERWGHGPPGGHTGGSSGGPPSGQGPCSLGWQACMSSLCASVAGGETDTAGPTGTTEVPPVAATADATGTDLSDALTTSLGAGSKMRRQADISTATGAGETGDGTGLAPTATGTGSGMQGFG